MTYQERGRDSDKQATSSLIHRSAVHGLAVILLVSLLVRGPQAENCLEIIIPYAPILVTSRSKAQVCCRLPAVIVGSNPIGGHGCLL